MTRRERWAWGLLIAGALAIRLLELGSRPYQFDEGQVGYAAYLLSAHGDYHYMPVLHGPLNYELTALSHLVLGTIDAANRIPAALAGTIVVALPLGLRRQLGVFAAFAAGVLLCLSPTLLYHSRFGREELVLAAVSLGFVVVAAQLVRGPRRWHVETLGALLALSFATKEATFLHVPIGIVAGLAWLRLHPARWRALRDVRPAWWLSGTVVFALVFVILFGQFGTHFSGVLDGAYGGLRYWAHEHTLHRGGESWFAYLILLSGYELPLVVLGAIGGVWSLRRRHALGTGLLVASVLTLAIYSYAGERFAWLLVTTLLPLALLAGLGLQVLWHGRRMVAAGVTVVLAIALGWSDLHAQILRPNDPRELMTVAPTDAAVPRIARMLRVRDARARSSGLPRPTIEVDPNNGSASPWSWYLRELRAGYPDMASPSFKPSAHVLIVTDGARELLGDRLRDYTGTPFVLRTRRPPMGEGFTAARFARWFVTRTPWTELSHEREWLYVRRPDRPVARWQQEPGGSFRRRSSRSGVAPARYKVTRHPFASQGFWT